MFRFIAKWFAKVSYAWRQETEAATNELHAGLAQRLAQENRTLAAKLITEANEMDARIKQVEEMELQGFWLCEDGHEWEKMPNVRPAEDHAANLCVISVNGKECGGEVMFIKRDQMTGQEKYQSDKERGEAQDVAKSKREQAKAEEENAVNSEKTTKYFQGLAQTNRNIASKLRKL